MTNPDAVRLVAAMSAVEMALVRNDPVAGPLLAQAVRAAEGVLPEVDSLRCALAIVRSVDLSGDEDHERAARKVAQALALVGMRTDVSPGGGRP